jgi:tetratricopeptide (TPR) repeat protein
MDNQDNKRALELEVAALRTLMPRLILAWTSELLGDYVLSDQAMSAAVAPIARDEAERTFLMSYTRGVVRDMRAIVQEASAAVAAQPPIDQLVSLGDRALGSGEPAEALARFEEALAREPGHFVLLHRRAIALRRLGRVDEALASLDEALRPGTKGSSPVYAGLARAVRSSCLHSLGRNTEALADAQIATGVCPAAPEPLLVRARALVALGRGSEGVDVYDDIIERADELDFDDDLTLEEVEQERDAVASAILSGGIEPDPRYQQ